MLYFKLGNIYLQYNYFITNLNFKSYIFNYVHKSNDNISYMLSNIAYFVVGKTKTILKKVAFNKV